MTVLKPGLKLKSAVCDTQLIVIRAPGGDIDLRCGGSAMLAGDAAPPPDAALAPDQAGGTLVGKRYTDAAEKIELLCTKAGKGLLMADGEALAIKTAKALPSSD
jgi:hypothetical protein